MANKAFAYLTPVFNIAYMRNWVRVSAVSVVLDDDGHVVEYLDAEDNQQAEYTKEYPLTTDTTNDDIRQAFMADIRANWGDETLAIEWILNSQTTIGDSEPANEPSL